MSEPKTEAERAVEEAREVHLTGKVGGMDESTGRPLLRLFEAQTGYDCVESPCGKGQCGKRPGSSHGRHGDEWVYSVTNGLFAVSLRVFTDRLRGVRDEKLRRSDGKGSSGAVLDAHSSTPTSEDQIREGRKGMECQYIEAGRCFGGFSGYLVADEFFAEHGRDTQEQTDGFWQALEAKWRDLRASVAADLPSVERCMHCEGAGLVKPVEPLLTDPKAMTLVESARRHVPAMERKVLEDLFVRTAEAFMKTRTFLAEAQARAEKAEGELEDAKAGERFAKEYGHEVERARTLGLTAGLLRATETCATMSAAALAIEHVRRTDDLPSPAVFAPRRARRHEADPRPGTEAPLRALVGSGARTHECRACTQGEARHVRAPLDWGVTRRRRDRGRLPWAGSPARGLRRPREPWRRRDRARGP